MPLFTANAALYMASGVGIMSLHRLPDLNIINKIAIINRVLHSDLLHSFQATKGFLVKSFSIGHTVIELGFEVVVTSQNFSYNFPFLLDAERSMKNFIHLRIRIHGDLMSCTNQRNPMIPVLRYHFPG